MTSGSTGAAPKLRMDVVTYAFTMLTGAACRFTFRAPKKKPNLATYRCAFGGCESRCDATRQPDGIIRLRVDLSGSLTSIIFTEILSWSMPPGVQARSVCNSISSAARFGVRRVGNCVGVGFA